MSTHLVTVMTGQTVLDSGSGFVLCHDTKIETGVTADYTYLLTCAHTLRAIGRRAADAQGNPIRIQVSGKPARLVNDPDLASRDLAVLVVDGRVGEVDPIGVFTNREQVRCDGFGNFFQQQFAFRQVVGRVKESVVTHSAEGFVLTYLKIAAKSNGTAFAVGLSGGPVYALGQKPHRPSKPLTVIGVSRILEVADGGKVAYAIAFDEELLQLIQSHLPQTSSEMEANVNQDRPPSPPHPLTVPDDLQKNRWEAKRAIDGYELTVDNLEKYAFFFVFDIVLRDTQGSRLVPPFVFHLHDSYTRSVIWIRRTDGRQAVLEQVSASGTYTLAVQFKDGAGQWRSLEYDLATDNNSKLAKYD